MAEEVERDALGAEQRAGIAGDGEQRRPGRDRVAVARMRGDADGGIELSHRRFDQRQAADHPGLARRDHGAGGGAGRHGGGRGDVAGAAEVFGERTGDGLVDDEGRQEGVGVERLRSWRRCLAERTAGRNGSASRHSGRASA